ncbi:hypothetical protein ACSDR0_16945 [Streptosporangium sp. G11]|uniref:hypothetical protein n=1 Tax=Streptosporangium sp. G11 TaxID=3436926 RepID=UPI003EB84F83
MAITLIAAVLVGVTGGILAWLGGALVANAIIVGGSSFAGTVLLILAIAYFLIGEKS